jgi:hypothetical protein
MDHDGQLPEGLDPDILERVVTVDADTVHIDKMRHEATVHGFTFSSDEPESLGGDDQYPYPLDYFTAAVGL